MEAIGPTGGGGDVSPPAGVFACAITSHFACLISLVPVLVPRPMMCAYGPSFGLHCIFCSCLLVLWRHSSALSVFVFGCCSPPPLPPSSCIYFFYLCFRARVSGLGTTHTQKNQHTTKGRHTPPHEQHTFPVRPPPSPPLASISFSFSLFSHFPFLPLSLACT